MRTIYGLLILTLFITCASDSDEKDKSKNEFEKYKYSETAEKDLFFNQASWYLKMEQEDLGIVTYDDDSLITEYAMFNTHSPFLVKKIYYKNEDYSILYRVKNRVVDSYVYKFDKYDKLIAIKDYIDFPGRTLNQWIELDSLYQIAGTSFFAYVSPDTLDTKNKMQNAYYYFYPGNLFNKYCDSLRIKIYDGDRIIETFKLLAPEHSKYFKINVNELRSTKLSVLTEYYYRFIDSNSGWGKREISSYIHVK